MKDHLWKLVSVVVVLTIVVSGLAMLLAGCGPEEEKVIPTSTSMRPTATTMPAAPPTDTPVPPQAEPAPPLAEIEKAAGLIDDFEGGDFDDRWWSFTDENTVSFTCTSDQPGHASEQAMRLTFEVGAGSWPGCGLDVDPSRWGDAGGLSFFWRADQAGLEVIVILSMEDPAQTYPDSKGVTPFEAVLQTPGEEWTPVTLKWDDLAKAEWVGESGTGVLDPTRVVALIFQANEAQSGSVWVDDLQLATGPAARPVPTLLPTAPAALPQAGPMMDKWSLWADGTQLRGANIWQHVVVPWVDGDEFLGDGHVGPPFVQEDLDRLAAMGANYVNISGPGLFTEKPPYVLDEAVQAHLDNLLDMIAQADMFAVITARTGPGRSDFTFYWDESADWGDASLLNDDVWLKQDAQDAWVEMWRYTAERYRDNPVVVGYDLMCEPNGPGRLLEIWNGEDFYPAYAGTLYDWNQLYPRLVQAIRQVDPDTPILISAMGWGSVRWLPFLEPVDDPRTVYMVHQYEPQEQYTHQPYPASNSYPGSFDLNWDGAPDVFDRAWLDGCLSIIDDFKAQYGVPVAVNEFGVMRWSPGAADFMRDSMDLFEQRGMNHAFWAWNPLWPPYSHVDDMNYLRGPDPDDHTDLATSDLIDVITQCWGRNTIRPSSVAEEPAASPTPLSEQPSPQPAEASFRRVIFLHHSCGANLIEQGGVRQRLTELGCEFYDHGYNEDGLVLADGTWTGRNFHVPDDNTDPDGFANIFAQPLHDPPDNTFSHLMQYDVIAFKSCFPVSLIESDEQLAGYKSYYLAIRDRMDQYPNKIFIVVTQPPEIPADSDAEMATRARAFTNWLASDEYLSGHPNVFTFNFFDLLADPSTHMLRPEYQTDEYDAHPNELANQTIAPLFVDFVDQAVRTYTAR